MEKIISLYQRDYAGDRLVMDEVVPGAEWVLAGEGVPTRKLDGTCCMVQGGKLLKRYEVKQGKTPPAGFVSASEIDPNTGKQQGWILVGSGPEDQYHREAFAKEPYFESHRSHTADMNGKDDGTYELIGPKIQGNPEHLNYHILVAHSSPWLELRTPARGGAQLDFQGIKAYLSKTDIEGIVWHHPDGRMVKIKGRDFGITRKEFT